MSVAMLERAAAALGPLTSESSSSSGRRDAYGRGRRASIVELV